MKVKRVDITTLRHSLPGPPEGDPVCLHFVVKICRADPEQGRRSPLTAAGVEQCCLDEVFFEASNLCGKVDGVIQIKTEERLDLLQILKQQMRQGCQCSGLRLPGSFCKNIRSGCNTHTFLFAKLQR